MKSKYDRRRAIKCKILKKSSSHEGYCKYKITICELDGTTHSEVAYGKDMQDALSRLINTERTVKVEKKIEKEKDGFLKKKLQDRLSILSGSVGIVRVGADSKVEMKEKKDRVEDAIYAVKAALKEGIISGGGIALLNASQKIKPSNECENILLRAIRAPYETILENASIEDSVEPLREGWGFDVVSGGHVNMVKGGIIDPVLVTKTALKNAVSVVSTIISADCVISNMRTNESN